MVMMPCSHGGGGGPQFDSSLCIPQSPSLFLERIMATVFYSWGHGRTMDLSLNTDLCLWA